MSLNILIAGANGFVGSALIRKFMERKDAQVNGIYRMRKDRLIQGNHRNLTYAQCDLTERRCLYEIFRSRRFDVVINAAASVSKSNSVEYMNTAIKDNVLAQANLLSRSLETGCRRYIYCSSISVYEGNPQDGKAFREDNYISPCHIYGWSKYAGEELLRINTLEGNAMKGISLRFSGIHGKGRETGIIYNMIKRALQNESVNIEEPYSRFNFCFIDDIVQAVLLCMEKSLPRMYNCYNVAGRETVDLIQLFNRIKKITGTVSAIQQTKSGRRRIRTLDTTKIQKELGYRPRSLDAHLSTFIDCIRS
jgi:nucleoside-diphosphate-sugar epimerase